MIRLFGAVGRGSLEFFRQAGAMAMLFARASRCAFTTGWRRSVIADQMHAIGVQSVPIVLVTGLFTGMVLAVQSYYQFRRLSVETLIGTVIGFSLARELGPVLTALMLSGRVGASMAAEIGTMKVTEQVDAMRSLATDPVSYLVFPRLLACTALMPLLAVCAVFVGVFGGFGIAVGILDVNQTFFLHNLKVHMGPMDVISGMMKAVVFGAIIATVGCSKGMETVGGAEGVGRATTSSVVTASILVLTSDLFITLLYQLLGI